MFLCAVALFALTAAGLVTPGESLAVCACGNGDGQPTLYEPITIDGDVAEWGTPSQTGTVLADEDNNVCDGPSGGIVDLDAPVQSTGRDIVQFTFTYDGTWLYFYTERIGSSSNTQTFLYYADTNDNGYQEDGEPVIVAEWKGNNRNVDIFVAQYNPVDAVNGDATVDSAGFGDGYALPGNLKNIPKNPDYSGTWGSTGGLTFEFAVEWTKLGFSVPVGHTIHVSSTNANKNANNLGAQIDDNLGGCGGGAGSTQYANLDFSLAYTFSGYWGDTVWGLHHLVNLGNGDDSFAFASTVLPTTWSPTVTLYLDDGDSIFDTGDSVIAGTVALASGSSVDIFTVYTIPSFSSGIATVVTTATSQYNTIVTDSVTDTVNALYPNITTMKYISAVADSTAATPGGADKALPGAVITYTIDVSNGGNAPPNADTLIVRDNVPTSVSMYIGTGAASPVTFDAGTTLLSYTYSSLASTGDDIAFTSESSGSPVYTYTPVPVAGYDSAVTGFKIEPKGDFDGSTSFDLTYQVIIP